MAKVRAFGAHTIEKQLLTKEAPKNTSHTLPNQIDDRQFGLAEPIPAD